MGDILKEWLGSTVERELRIALELWERMSSFGSDADKYDDDGTTLRIKLSKGYPVQITKLVNLHGPITVLVSDSMTDINASITNAAAQHFLTKSRRRVTQGTLGGIIHLQNFDIMATYMGPDNSCRITLSIKTFEFLGSEASPVFGRPSAIQNSIAIQSLETKLRALWGANFAQLEPAAEDKPNSDFIPQSELDQFELSSDDSEETSQQALATQAPPRSRKTNPKIYRSSADGKTISPAQLKHIPSVKEGHVTDKKNARSALSGSPSRHSSVKPSRPTGNGVRKQSEALLQLLPSDLARAKREIRSVGSPMSSVGSKSNDIERQEAKAKPTKNAGHYDALVARDPVHLVEGQSLPLQQEPFIGAVAEDKHNSTRVEAESPGQVWLEIPSRISRREVIIPKNQQHLLEQSESWLPVEPGRRYPFANVPIKTLQEISESADRRAARLSKQPKKVEPTPLEQSEQGQLSELDKESDGESGYDSDSLSSSEWPPSPPEGGIDMRQLPPDSSPELPTDAAKFSQKKTQEQPSSLSPPRPKNPARIFKKQKSVSTSPSHSPPSSSRRSAHPIESPNLHPKPTPQFKNDQSLSSLAHCGQVTETDYSQETEGDQTRKESGIPETRRLRDAMKDHDDSTANRVAAIKEQVSLVNSKNTDASQPGLDSHEISMTEIESSGHGPGSQISNVNAEIEKERSHVDNTSIESGPSTASQREEPGLQVKRTPYCNGQVSDVDSQRLESCQSPSKSRSLPFANDIRITRDSDASSTQPDVIKASSIGSQREILGDDLAICSDGEAARNCQIRKQDVSNGELASYSPGEETGHNIPDEDLIAWQLQREIASQSQSGTSRSTYVEETRLIVEETVFQGTADLRTDLLVPVSIQATNTNEDGRGMKRKLLENELVSPNITKRRRNLRDVGKPNRKLEDISAIERALGILSKGASVSPPNQEDAIQLSVEDRSKLLSQGRNEKTAGHDGESPASRNKPEKPSTRSKSAPPNPQVRQASEDKQGLREKPQTSTDDPVDELMIDVDAQEKKAEKSPNKADSVSGGSVQPARSITMFDRFKLSYPEYMGTMQHFTAICSKLQKQFDAGRGLHQALWDDFIIRHKIEYANYLQNCANKAEDPMPYDKFYEDEIDGARFIKQVVTRKTLHEALALLPIKDKGIKDRGKFTYVHASSGLDKSRHSPRNSQLEPRCASPQIIDLSEKRSEKSSRRSLPWPSPNTPRSSDKEIEDKGEISYLPAGSLLDKPRHSPRNSQLESGIGSPQIIDLSEKRSEKSSHRPLPWLSPNTPRSTLHPNLVTSSAPRPSFLSRIRSNQPYTSGHLSRKKSETAGNSPALVSTVNAPSTNRGEVSILEAPSDRAPEVAPAVDADYRREKRNGSRTIANASPRDGHLSRSKRGTDRASSDALSLDAPHSRIGRGIRQTSSNAPPSDAPRSRVIRDKSQTSSDAPLLGTYYRRIKRGTGRASRESPMRDTDYRNMAKDPDQMPENPLLDTAHSRVKRDPDQASNEIPLPDAGPYRSKRDSDRPIEDTPRRTSERLRVKRDTNHAPDTTVSLGAKRHADQLSKPPTSPHRSSKRTEPNPSTATILPKPAKTEIFDDDETKNPLIKFAREYLAIEAGRGNSFAGPKGSDDVKEKPKLRKLDVANWHL